MQHVEALEIPQPAEPAKTHTQRIRLDCAYKGTHFRGWAKQPGLRTVQGVNEAALAMIFRVPIELTVAGRTDAGVHAEAQTAHFDVNTADLLRITKAEAVESALLVLTRRLNRLVGRPREIEGGEADLVIYRLTAVDASFDARFAALRRHYVYRLAGGQLRNPLYGDVTWWVEADLDLTAMRAAAAHLVGEHDFLSFCKPRKGASTVRTLETLELVAGPAGLEVRLSADAFCHSMVRSMVGALVEVGRGRRAPGWVQQLVAHPSRDGAAPLAPPHGLALAKVDYPRAENWADQQMLTRRFRGDCPPVWAAENHQ
ncbi:MAG: tRNA pseudouridine(38-40) synthase TruA [Actinomycetaceae bacterium]|nr:tRNA pseudouridine(38-40) synthase TruA [Actinomycetaceae bacterium]